MFRKSKLEKLKDEHAEELRMAAEHSEKAKNIEAQIVNSVFDQYIDPEKRKQLIEQAQTICYSEEKLNIIIDVFENYNKDNVTFNVANEIMEVQKDIKEHNKESFFSTISNIVLHGDE